MKLKKFLILLLFVTIIPINVSAKRGCCSHHGGVSHCNTSIGKYICNDGSVSPSCTCERIDTTKTTTTTSKNTSISTSTSSKLVTTDKITSTTAVVMNVNTNSDKEEDNDENDSNDMGATLGGLGIVGATIAVIANRKKVFKKR